MLITLVFDLNLWGLGFIITYGKIDHPKCRSLSLVLLSPFSPSSYLLRRFAFTFSPLLPHCFVSPTTAVLCFFVFSFPQTNQRFCLEFVDPVSRYLFLAHLFIFLGPFFWCGRQSWIPELKSEDRWKSDDCANLLFEDERSGAVTSARADTHPAAV